MGIITWLKAFLTGVPTPEMAERWRLEDERKAGNAPSRKLSATPGNAKSPVVADKRPRIRPGTSGSSATFDYSDRYGRPSRRRVHDWRSEAEYVHGYCLDKGCELTFNKRRIQNWEPS